MRGEQAYGDLSEDGGQGSPPHARGAVQSLAFDQHILRITPACAGSSCRSCPLGAALWDHPRMRGEQTKKVQSYKGFFVFFYQISFNS